jgi:uroporphyrinogen III methyltransferase/synthase
MSGLAGKRILVTRARDQAEKTAASIRARGGEPVLLPTIEIHPPRDAEAVRRALAGAKGHAWVAFTSDNGVEHAWRALEAMGAGAGAFEGVKVAAIGKGTAAALERRGVRADVVASESKGEGLADAVLAAMEPGESLLLLRAQVAREAFPEALARAGHRVEVCAVYETRPGSGPAVARAVAELEGGRVHAATFTSASTVDSFVALVGGRERARSLLAPVVVGSIGPVTTGALAAQGIRVDAGAAEATLEALLAALEVELVRRN